MDRLYYTYLIIKESLDYIPAIEIKMLLEEKYQIKVDIKTVYQAIRNINELSHYIYQKDIIKTKHRKGYTINEKETLVPVNTGSGVSFYNFRIIALPCRSHTGSANRWFFRQNSPTAFRHPENCVLYTSWIRRTPPVARRS